MHSLFLHLDLKYRQDNPIEIIILFVVLILHHRKCISVQVSTDTQIKGLDKGGCECLKCYLEIESDKLGF